MKYLSKISKCPIDIHMKIAVKIISRDIRGVKMNPSCLRLIKRSRVFHAGFIRNTFNRVFCLEYSNNNCSY